jgi:hypothetical protein
VFSFCIEGTEERGRAYLVCGLWWGARRRTPAKSPTETWAAVTLGVGRRRGGGHKPGPVFFFFFDCSLAPLIQKTAESRRGGGEEKQQIGFWADFFLQVHADGALFCLPRRVLGLHLVLR